MTATILRATDATNVSCLIAATGLWMPAKNVMTGITIIPMHALIFARTPYAVTVSPSRAMEKPVMQRVRHPVVMTIALSRSVAMGITTPPRARLVTTATHRTATDAEVTARPLRARAATEHLTPSARPATTATHRTVTDAGAIARHLKPDAAMASYVVRKFATTAT